MAEQKGTPDGEHIEELLSQLKGIFGHLSETEQEEAKQKITPPSVSLPSFRTDPTPTPEPEPPPPEHTLSPNPTPEVVPMTPPDPVSTETPPPPPAADFAPAEVSVPSGASLVPAAVFYPAGRMNEAKIVTEKIEKITPKFTKVAVVINVQSLVAYDPKSDVKTVILSQLAPQIRAVFVLIDKTLDDVRRKNLIAQLEPKGVYFQEIPFHQIEKKALYTDMLLGMVFFFDSQKKPGEPSE